MCFGTNDPASDNMNRINHGGSHQAGRYCHFFINLISIYRIGDLDPQVGDAQPGDLDPQVVHLPVNLLVHQEVGTDNMGRISHGGALQAGRHS